MHFVHFWSQFIFVGTIFRNSILNARLQADAQWSIYILFNRKQMDQN